MLFSKKTMVSVLALGTLLSVASKVQADQNAASSIPYGKIARTLGGAALTFYTLGVHDVKNDNKHAALRKIDAPVSYLQRLVNFVTSKEGMAAIGLTYVSGTLLFHGKDAKVYQLVSNLLAAAPKAPTPPPASN